MGNIWKNNTKVLSGAAALEWLRNIRSGGKRSEPAPTQPSETGGPRETFESIPMSSRAAFPGYAHRGHTPPENDTWTCETSEVVGRCPLLSHEKTTVRIPYTHFFTWQLLAQKHKDEWFAYVTGDWDENTGNATVDGFYFPPQRAGGAHCEPVLGAFEFLPRTIGSVHSHNVMAAFFSGTDLAHMNWQVEMVINAKGDMVGKTRVKFKCGEFGRYDATLKLVLPAGENAAARDLEAALGAGKPSAREPEKEEQSQSIVPYEFAR